MNFLESFLGNSELAIYLSALIILAGGYILGRLLKILLRFLKHGVSKRTKTSLDDFLLAVLKRCIVGVAFLATAYWVTKALVPEADHLGAFAVSAMPIVREIIYVLLVMYGSLTVARLVDSVVLWYLKDIASRTQTHLDDELAPLVNRILNILVFVLAVIVILDHFHQNVSTLVVSLGVGSLAIALAAQETLANMIAGFVLMIDRPFRKGDRVRLPSGLIGNVYEIGMRSTKVIDDGNIMIITPNAEIVKSQIWNLSYPNDMVRFEVPFSIAYGTEIDRMRALVIGAVNAEPDVVEPETTEVRITELAESSVHACVMFKVRRPETIPRRRSDLTKLIYDTLRANGIEMPFPQRVVHFKTPPAGETNSIPSNE
jgi:MscS family membrane protein